MRSRHARVMSICLALAVAAATATATAGDTPEPGVLQVPSATAVQRDARLPDGAEPSSYAWRIVEGDGAKLFSETSEDAVFLAPTVETGVKEFVIELTVTYAGEAPSVRQMRIRVIPMDAMLAEESEDDDGTPAWLREKLERQQEARERKEAQQPSFGGITGSYSSGPTVTIGVRSGWGGGWGGVGIGYTWRMSYPVSQPVQVPPPGTTHAPGQGVWDPSQPIPYVDLKTK